MVTTGLLFAPPSLGPTVKITALTLTSISTLVVLVRFYCRIWVVGKLKSYDYLIVPAVLLTWALCILNWFQVHYGSGSHDWALTTDPVTRNRWQAAGVWFSYQLIYPVVPAFVKLSILFFYRSIATERTFRLLVHATIAFVTASTVGMVVATALECPKPSLAYSEFIFLRRKQYKCLEIRNLYYAQASMNIFSDIVVFILPLPTLLKLNMPTHKRVGLLCLFGVGLLVPIAAAFRIQALHLWAKAARNEQRYHGGYVIFWDQVESNTAIICASAPSLQPLFKGLFGRLSQYSRGRDMYYYYGEGETGATQITIGRRVTRPVETDFSLESPTPTYQPQHQKNDGEGDIERGVVPIREVKEDPDEEIRNRIRAFAVRPLSSHPPNSLARLRDILSSG